MIKQVNDRPLLFPIKDFSGPSTAPVISKDGLLTWKNMVQTYQQQERTQEAPVQLTLFDLGKSHCSADEIDPFSLTLHPHQFWRLPVDGGDACVYFVLDNSLPLLLYIGETARSHKRWKGTHDCKQYLENYISLHRQYDLAVEVCISFWWDVPTGRSPRQKLESQLIYKWLPPFNKQCWTRWGQPCSK